MPHSVGQPGTTLGEEIDDINSRDEKGRTTLIFAASTGCLGLAKVALDKGAKIDIPDRDGCTALNYAVAKGHIEVVALLLARGAEVDRRDGAGDTNLHAAITDENVEIVRLLLENSADVRARSDGKTAVELADLKGNHEIVALVGGDLGRGNRNR